MDSSGILNQQSVPTGIEEWYDPAKVLFFLFFFLTDISGDTGLILSSTVSVLSSTVSVLSSTVIATVVRTD